MDIPKPMNADEVFNFGLHLERMYPEESRSRLWLEAALVVEQHRRDMARFVALLRKRAKVPRGFADGFIDAYSLVDELEQAANTGSTS